MYNVHYLNKISPEGLELLTEDYTAVSAIEEADAVLVRSASMHEMELPEGLLDEDLIILENTEYTLDVGDTFEFSKSDITVDESLIPEGVDYQISVIRTEFPPIEWTDENHESFRVQFNEEGVFYFDVEVEFAKNCIVTKRLYFVV